MHRFPFKQSITDLAERLGITRQHLSEVLNGTARCGGALAFRIEDATKGRIKARDLVNGRKVAK